MSSLFEPTTLAGMSLRNRLVKSATIENMATAEGVPTAEARRFYQRLARGGVGLITTGYAYVNLTGQSYPLQMGAHTDAAVAAWRPIVDAVHEQGAKIALQIAHGGRQTKARALGGRQGAAPSAVPNFVYFTRPRAMSPSEIRETIADFALAAARAKAVGFDAVQIHEAHGYLISSFLSPLTNRRRDEWGGDPERRFRFLGEVYCAVREAVGEGYPVLCKLNVDDGVWVGLTPRESFPVARRLAALGVDGIEISGGIVEMVGKMSRGKFPADIFCRNRGPLEWLWMRMATVYLGLLCGFKEGYYVPYARQLKPTLSVPLTVVGGIRQLETAERVVAEGSADYVALARPLLREPGLPNRWREGRREPAQCTSCNRCLGEVDQGNVVRCYRRGSAGPD